MKISTACPESIRKSISTEDANNHGAAGAVTTWVEGALLTFEIAGDTLEARLQSVRDLDAELGLAIADEDRPHMIASLGDLKAVVASLPAIVTRESSYIDTRESNYLTRGMDELAAEVAEATSDTVVSQLQGEQHTSTEDSSEQHGAVSLNDEENVNVETDEEEPAAEQLAGGKRAGRG